MAIDREGTRASAMVTCSNGARVYGLDRDEALDIVRFQIDAINDA